MDYTASFPLIAAWILIAPVIVVAVLNGVGAGSSHRREFRRPSDDLVVPPRPL